MDYFSLGSLLPDFRDHQLTLWPKESLATWVLFGMTSLCKCAGRCRTVFFCAHHALKTLVEWLMHVKSFCLICSTIVSSLACTSGNLWYSWVLSEAISLGIRTLGNATRPWWWFASTFPTAEMLTRRRITVLFACHFGPIDTTLHSGHTDLCHDLWCVSSGHDHQIRSSRIWTRVASFPRIFTWKMPRVLTSGTVIVPLIKWTCDIIRGVKWNIVSWRTSDFFCGRLDLKL